MTAPRAVADGVWVITGEISEARPSAHRDDLLRAAALPEWRAREFLAGRGLLRRLLTAVRPELTSGAVAPDAHGKPWLRACPGAGVSVSHSRGRLAAAVAVGARVGVDVQRPGATVTASFARRLLGETGAEALAGLPAARAAEEVAWVWTAQEACVKADGRGLAGRPAVDRRRGARKPLRTVGPIPVDRSARDLGDTAELCVRAAGSGHGVGRRRGGATDGRGEDEERMMARMGGECRTLHDWFADSVPAHGDRIALEAGATRLTYGELSALADRVAARLVDVRGGEVPRRVGLAAGRTAVAYAGYLAVQRLGATVVPLGPAFPAERNAAVSRAAALDTVLTDGTCDHADRLPAPVLRLTDEELPALAAAADLGLPTPSPHADDLAYILFTSGSTGVPKGVPVRHRNIHAYLAHAVPHHGAPG